MTPVLGIHKSQLDTPCLVIDIDLLLKNLLTMQQHANTHQIQIRPHCKTHKCSTLAKLQLKYGAVGISAAKLSEAESLVHHGIQSILITSPIVTPYKIERLMKLLKLAPDLIVVVDNHKNRIDLNDAAEKHNCTLNVLVDINSGIGRTGIDMPDALGLAEAIHQDSPALKLSGIQCYAGNLQHIENYQERRKQSQTIMTKAADCFAEFKKRGLPASIFTGGGTGTYDIDSEVVGLTEIQPGSYTVMDVEYASIGSKNNPEKFEAFSPAMTLLTSVISHNQKTHVTVDAGTKAIYVDNNNLPRIVNRDNLRYEWGGFGDEHGKVSLQNNTESTLPLLGEVLEMVVPHCDPTINLYDRFYITQHDHVIDVWEIDMRGHAQ